MLNGKMVDTEVVRLSLIPCLLKSLRNNNHHPKPTCLFEVGDVVVPDYAGCAYASIPQPKNGEKRCEGVCGGGCCAAHPLLNPHNTVITSSSTSATAASGTTDGVVDGSNSLALAPNPYTAPLFEYPNILGILRSDTGARNERHFAAVRCGPDVIPENLIPAIARILNNFRLLFNGEGEAGLVQPAKGGEGGGGDAPNVLNGIAGYWEMLPPSVFVSSSTAQTSSSSHVRWLSDSASFIHNNYTLICITLKEEGAGTGSSSSTTKRTETGTPLLYRIPVGIMGILRPDVVKRFGVHSNVVAFEINLEPLYVRLL